ncbi:uncharacterized protein EAF02_005783 [Botrytis sinoallii]|uniref:uncharacterized protein n=1 Tax=Botrytis sinoallii TaxID=1463999 RepID=UPI0019026DA5|nr:uncharacterized protein EAF02_005783 [Botrytis sinoallii]KAF7882420.1 hypothetical protein EAF02_005783 [Botrytis sinoallii]
MSKPNEPNNSPDPTDPNKQTIESVSLPQISIPSTSDSPSPSPTSPSSPPSPPQAVSHSHSADSPSSPPFPLPTTLSLISLEIESKSHSHTHPSSPSKDEEPPNPPAEPSTETQPSSPAPDQPGLSLPLFAFTSSESKTALINCGFITFTPEELDNASYDFLVARVIISIEKKLRSQREEAQKHVEWMEESGDGGEGLMGDGIKGGEMGDGGGVSSSRRSRFRERIETGTNIPLPRRSIRDIWSTQEQGIKGEKDRKKRWEFQIYEDPVDGKPEGFETTEMREMRRMRPAGERWAIELASGGQRVRECAGENQENEEGGRSRQTRRDEDVGESGNDEVDDDGQQPAEPHPTRSALSPPPTQSRIPLAPLSRLPKHKECKPITLYIHWNPEPLIPAAYVERTTRMCPIVGASRRSLFQPATPGDGDRDRDGGNLVKEAENLPAEDESNREEEENPAQARAATLNDPIETSSTTALENLQKMNLTTLHPSFPTHLQFGDLYGDSDSDSSSTATNSEGIQEMLRFLHERGGRDELIVEYLLL